MAKIMVVDDDKLVTSQLEELLFMEGYETITVNESFKVIDTAQKTIPDLFLLDLKMPQPDGFKLCRMLRQKPQFAFTPIIIVTALDDSDSRAVAFGAGANDYIAKPFHLNALIQRIKEVLE